MNRYSLFFLPVCLIAPILMSVIGFTDLLPPGRFVHQGRTSETAQTMISHQRSAPATTAQSVARMSRSRETMLLSYQTRSRMLDAVNAHQIDAQQCYADPQLHTVTTQSVAAGTGRMVFSLDACPGQQALFGQFRLLDTGQPLTADSCAYIQNDLIGENQGAFAGDCSGQLDPGNLQTAPRPNDGRHWQACWIEYSVPLPQPVCTAFEQVMQGAAV